MPLCCVLAKQFLPQPCNAGEEINEDILSVEWIFEHRCEKFKRKNVFILHFIIHAIFQGSKPLLRPTLNVISKEQIILEKKLLFVQFSFTYKDQFLINPG